MKTYLELKQEAEQILKQAEEARKREANQVIKSVLNTLKNHGLTIDDLFAKVNRKATASTKIRRPVSIKYRGPNNETWTGRGQKPLWLAALINKGHSIEEFLIK